MRGGIILALHTALFLSFVAAMLASPFVAMQHPDLFTARNLLVFAIVAVATVGSWPLFGGCPFTIWENNAYRKENTAHVYSGPCIDHYLLRWFGVTLPVHVSTGILIILFCIPFVSGAIWHS